MTGTTVADGPGTMETELFGVFGGRAAFADRRSTDEFHVVLEGDRVTVGVRDPWLSVPGRSTFHEDDTGFAVVWGEAFAPTQAAPARLLKARFARVGTDAFEALNGSYVAVVEDDGRAVVATDRVRSWECFVTEATDPGLFGTDLGALASLVDDPDPDRTALRDLLYLSVVLGDRTLFDGIGRLPFDGYLTDSGVRGSLDRFVYAPDSFDHTAALARRLDTALGRRADYPGRKGLLLSAGQDSRSVLATVPDVDHCYTVGTPDAAEVRTARRLADQYDAAHTVLEPDERYLDAGGAKVRYTGGCRESLHAHHAGFDDELAVDTMYHGLLFDTLFKGYFIERETIGPDGAAVELTGTTTDADPVEGVLDTLGALPGGYERADALVPAVNGVAVDDPEGYLRDRVATEIDRCRRRADDPHNCVDLFALRTQPAKAFRTHLADRYLEANVAVDTALLEWHLRTPPRHRNPETVHDALEQLDDDIFRHPPPKRPHRSELANQLHRFARRTLPGLSAPGSAWPDWERCYEEQDLDATFFPESVDAAAPLCPRRKLRLRDADWWLSRPEATRRSRPGPS